MEVDQSSQNSNYGGNKDGADSAESSDRPSVYVMKDSGPTNEDREEALEEEDLGDDDDDREDDDEEAEEDEEEEAEEDEEEEAEEEDEEEAEADNNVGDDDDDADDGEDNDDEEEDEDEKDDMTNGALKGNTVHNKKKHRRSKIFDDAITVEIPLDVTADLKVAIKHTRAKRIKSILRRFPSIQNERKALADRNKGTSNDEDGAEDVEMDREENGEESNGDEKPAARANSKTKKRKPEHIPQPERFGSVLDYLEAKYVRGVMYDHEDDDEGGALDADDKSEGQGSVYSKDSFLDDTDLQRDVAEQVMATSTLTKLELEEDDGEFFVNVGNLEVENNEYGEQYDPLLDKENFGKKQKRKVTSTTPKSSSSDAKSAKSLKSTKSKVMSTEPPKKKKKVSETASSKKSTETAPTPGSIKSKKSTASSSSTDPASSKSKKSTTVLTPGSSKSKKSVESVSTVKTGSAKPSTGGKKKTSTTPKNPEAVTAMKAAKKKCDSLYKKIVGLVKKLPPDCLPKKQTKMKFSLTCPAGKGPGDEVVFTNPNNPTQRLKVKVPKDVQSGGTFRVTVPVKHSEADSGDNKDHNKFGREIQDLLDDYGRAYDDYCTARLVVYPAFEINKEKQAKFDKLATEFPTGLLTPVDANYLKQVARRARQNKYKRQRTAEARQNQLEVVAKKEAELNGEEQSDSDSDEEEEEAEDEKVVDVPGKGVVFPTINWQAKDFSLQ